MAHRLLIAASVTLSLASPFVKRASDVPQFVIDHAPLVFLDQTDDFFPSDIAAQIAHTHPTRGDLSEINAPAALSLGNLDSLYPIAGDDAFLTSNEGIATNPPPAWFHGVKPDPSGNTPGAVASVIITVAKPNDVLDAFYFNFYAFNKGIAPFGIPNFEFGNHVGDWEHTMIRFEASTGTPKAMWYSQHSSGQAFEFDAVRKDESTGKRPLVFSARGTHANYALPGIHSAVIRNLPFSIFLPDITSDGPLWDPLLSSYFYSFDPATSAFTALHDPSTGTISPQPNFLNYTGKWGDPQLPDDASGQINVLGQRKYTAGPTGPKDKRLGRANVCNVEEGEECVVLKTLILGKREVDDVADF